MCQQICSGHTLSTSPRGFECNHPMFQADICLQQLVIRPNLNQRCGLSGLWPRTRIGHPRFKSDQRRCFQRKLDRTRSSCLRVCIKQVILFATRTPFSLAARCRSHPDRAFPHSEYLSDPPLYALNCGTLHCGIVYWGSSGGSKSIAITEQQPGILVSIPWRKTPRHY